MANSRYLAAVAAMGLAMSLSGTATAQFAYTPTQVRQKVVQLHTVMIVKGVAVPPVVHDVFFADVATCKLQLLEFGRALSTVTSVEVFGICMENVLKTQL